MKLDPIIKLIGSLTVSAINKSTLFFLELFWIPIIKRVNKQRLKVTEKNIFFKGKAIFLDNLI